MRYGNRVSATRKVYDRAYFERWYRDPRYAVVGEGVRARRVQLAVAIAEYLLERPLRTVLDVGCGEGAWQPLLQHARPGVRYLGVDSSEYAIERFGAARNLRLGSLATLHRMKLKGPYDLIVCSDVLHYVSTDEMRRGLKTIAGLLGGVAFLELFTGDDETEGDGEGLLDRSPALYRRALKQAGLIHLGMHCYAGELLADQLTTFERAER
jgi:SAM-dependent methyltransferase